MTKDIHEHKRINDILLGPLERPALRWLAKNMPGWVTPDLLTAVGFVGSLIALAGYGLSSYDPLFLWLASVGFIINWFGDSLDGTLARYRHIERPIYGFYIDHSMDIVTEALFFIGLGISPYVRFDVALLALIGYFMISNLVYIQTCVMGEFRISYAGLGPTEVRVLAIAANTAIFFGGNPQIKILGISNTVFDWLVIAVIVLLYSIFTASWIINARKLKGADSQYN